MRQTPWTQKSSVSSDFIKSNLSRSPTPNTKITKAKSKQQNQQQQQQQPPRSKDVKRLDALVKALHNTSENDSDPKGGCFCQGQCRPKEIVWW